MLWVLLIPLLSHWTTVDSGRSQGFRACGEHGDN
jgi:hypothetical protein